VALRPGWLFYQLYVFLNKEIKKSKLKERKTIFTTLAKGGAPSGHICPVKTTRFNTNRMISMVFLVFDIGFIM
jgi:hypothetical protein